LTKERLQVGTMKSVSLWRPQ